MAYNLTGIGDNATNVVGFVQSVNSELMFGFMGILFLIGFFVIALLGFTYSTRNFPKSLLASSFASFLVCLLMRAMNLVPDLAIFITLALTAFSAAITWKTS